MINFNLGISSTILNIEKGISDDIRIHYLWLMPIVRLIDLRIFSRHIYIHGDKKSERVFEYKVKSKTK
jgi:hypothetical protein